MSSRRFRKLELGNGPLDPDAAKQDGTDVCRRCGAEHREGEARCGHCAGVLGGPGQQEFDEAFHARRMAAEMGILRSPAEDIGAPVESAGRNQAAGFGGILAAGALTACVFALVSIPVRLAFAASSNDSRPGRAIFELLFVAGITFALRRIFAAELRKL